MGKTRVASEISARLHPKTAVAILDLFLPELRAFDTGLLSLRIALGKRLGRGSFPLFDLGFAHYWQQTHPGTSRDRSAIPFLEESEILSNIVGSLATLPLVGGIMATVKLGNKAFESVRDYQILKSPVLAEALSLPIGELAKVLPELLALDLSACRPDERPLIIIDTFEALQSDKNLVDGSSAQRAARRRDELEVGIPWMDSAALLGARRSRHRRRDHREGI